MTFNDEDDIGLLQDTICGTIRMTRWFMLMITPYRIPVVTGVSGPLE